MRQESANERFLNTLKDLLQSNTVSQKEEKPHTAGLDDTAREDLNYRNTAWKKAQYPNTVNPNVPLAVMELQNSN